MKDLAVEPYVVIGKGEKALYKFKNGNTLYSKKEFFELIKKSLKEGMNNQSEAIEETKTINRKNGRKKSIEN